MKRFKIIDFWISVGLIIFFAILTLTPIRIPILISVLGVRDSFGNLIAGYFVVGGWQVVSMLVHAIAGWFSPRGSARERYSALVLVLIVLVSLGLWFQVYQIIFVLYPLLFLAPVMALYYTYMCYREVFYKMRERPLDVLK